MAAKRKAATKTKTRAKARPKSKIKAKPKTKAKVKVKAKAKAKVRARAKISSKTEPRTIDQYLAALSGDKRVVALQRLREAIRAAAPEAEECISYSLAAFRQHGILVAFGATENHCAFYPMSSTTIEAYKEDLKGYDTSKGTIRFQADKPLPADLVHKLVRARLAENQARAGLG